MLDRVIIQGNDLPFGERAGREKNKNNFLKYYLIRIKANLLWTVEHTR